MTAKTAGLEPFGERELELALAQFREDTAGYELKPGELTSALVAEKEGRSVDGVNKQFKRLVEEKDATWEKVFDKPVRVAGTNGHPMNIYRRKVAK